MFPSITGETAILGVIADPIAQAHTPEMANLLLDERQQLGDYLLVPMEVKAEDLGIVVAGLKRLKNFKGAVVSMPHKQAIVSLVDGLTPTAKLVGAVNVIRRTVDGKLLGAALDGEAFVGGLRDAGHSVAGTSCLLAGAGGVASSIAFALAKHGCKQLYLMNRTQAHADSLLARIAAAFPQLKISTDIPDDAMFDIAVNGTSLGMHDDDELPIPLPLIGRATLVAECVVAPEMTRLLQRAQRAEQSIHTGVPMLAAQMNMMLAFMGVPERKSQA
jgi:shikimate dehydrogenase